MARTLDLSILGALALVGAGTGLHLGWSAIAEINPVHFSSAESGSAFHGDLVPNRSWDSGPSLPGPEQADSLALGSGCIGCRTYPVDYRPIPDPSIERIYEPSEQTSASAPVQLAAREEEAPEDAARRKADIERIELYSRAPIAVQEESVATPAVEQAQPAN
jgi:hypothetical protein